MMLEQPKRYLSGTDGKRCTFDRSSGVAFKVAPWSGGFRVQISILRGKKVRMDITSRHFVYAKSQGSLASESRDKTAGTWRRSATLASWGFDKFG